MIVLRSKKPLPLTGRRIDKTGIIAMSIKEFTFEPHNNRYRVLVQDYEVVDVENIGEPNSPLKRYIPINRVVRIRTQAEIDTLFNLLSQGLNPGESYTQELRNVLNEGLYFETQQLPVYGSSPDDWEIINTDDEVYNKDSGITGFRLA